MKPEPKPRRDGRCKMCRGPRPTNRQRGVPEWMYLEDPFCSATCSRRFWGTSLPYAAVGGRGSKSLTNS